jgi:hypothetical protein
MSGLAALRSAKQPVPDLIRGGKRFFPKRIMLKQKLARDVDPTKAHPAPAAVALIAAERNPEDWD